MAIDSFGYVPFAEPICYSTGEIRPVADAAAAHTEFQSRISQDGYIYPDLSWRFSDRPPQPWPLHKLPASHELEVDRCTSLEELRRGEGAFVMHFFGFLFGARSQFSEWWVEGRVATRNENGFGLYREWEVRRSIEAGVHTWTSLDAKRRTVLTNALFCHNRAPGYVWDWERFQAEYQVLDALHSVARALNPSIRKAPHSERLTQLIELYGMSPDDERISRIVAARNQLIHEALWEGHQLTGSSERDAHTIPRWLHRFNARLVLAIFCIPAEVVGTPWWLMGQCAYGLRHDS